MAMRSLHAPMMVVYVDVLFGIEVCITSNAVLPQGERVIISSNHRCLMDVCMWLQYSYLQSFTHAMSAVDVSVGASATD